MNKPASELIALADAIHAWQQNPATTYTPTNILQDHGDTVVELARLAANQSGVPPDITEFLMCGDPTRGVPPRVIQKAIKAALATPPAQPAPASNTIMTDDQIKYMVDRFLGWKLPENFNPDGGVSFEQFGNVGTEHQYRRQLSGTNLFDATQTTEMVRHMIDGMSDHGKPDGAVRQLEPWQFELDEVIGHLGSAIHQSGASDDQIIMDHVKTAHEIAKIVRRKA